MNMWRLILVVGILGVTVAVFMLGWSARAMWADWREDRALRAAEARHARHRARVKLERLADPEPLPWESAVMVEPESRLVGEPGSGPVWRFAGESGQGWAAEAAEYELLHQTAPQPVSATGEPPIDTGELLAITDRVESWIAQWTAQGNVDRHTIQGG